MTVTIDALTEREFFAWYALYSEYAAGQGTDLSDEQVMRVWTELQEPGAVSAVARDSAGEVVGLAHAVRAGRLLPGRAVTELEDLFVTPSSRRSGVASALVEHVLDRVRSGGLPPLRWEARPDDQAARALQERFASSSSNSVLQTLPVG